MKIQQRTENCFVKCGTWGFPSWKIVWEHRVCVLANARNWNVAYMFAYSLQCDNNNDLAPRNNRIVRARSSYWNFARHYVFRIEFRRFRTFQWCVKIRCLSKHNFRSIMMKKSMKTNKIKWFFIIDHHFFHVEFKLLYSTCMCVHFEQLKYPKTH